MTASRLQTLYNVSPSFVQTILLNLYAYKVHRERYGDSFRRVLNNLQETQFYTKARIEEYQNSKLRELVEHAYETVPYYKDTFNLRGLKPGDITCMDDLHKIPILTKDDVRNNADRLVSRRYKKSNLIHGHTSGTTGAPLEFYWDVNACIFNNAVDWRQKKWAGIEYGEPIYLLLGRTIVPTDRKKPPFWKKDYFHNQTWFSSFHMNDENMTHYVHEMIKNPPSAIEGYPSTVYILARFLVDSNMTLPLKAVFTSSETLYSMQKEIIERAFECKIYDYYGLAERVVFATECREHSGKHLNFEYGITEIVDDNDNPLSYGDQGKIVSTSLINFGMPFIRYKTSDITSIRPQTCACGREMPIIENIMTKAEDIILRPDGTMISPSILTHPFKPMRYIEKSQIIQKDLHSICIRIVPRNGYSEEDSRILLDGLQERVGNDMRIDIDLVEDIPRSKSGKFRWVISKVSSGINASHQD